MFYNVLYASKVCTHMLNNKWQLFRCYCLWWSKVCPQMLINKWQLFICYCVWWSKVCTQMLINKWQLFICYCLWWSWFDSVDVFFSQLLMLLFVGTFFLANPLHQMFLKTQMYAFAVSTYTYEDLCYSFKGWFIVRKFS